MTQVTAVDPYWLGTVPVRFVWLLAATDTSHSRAWFCVLLCAREELRRPWCTAASRSRVLEAGAARDGDGKAARGVSQLLSQTFFRSNHTCIVEPQGESRRTPSLPKQLVCPCHGSQCPGHHDMWVLDLGRGSRLRRGNVQEVFRSGGAALYLSTAHYFRCITCHASRIIHCTLLTLGLSGFAKLPRAQKSTWMSRPRYGSLPLLKRDHIVIWRSQPRRLKCMDVTW